MKNNHALNTSNGNFYTLWMKYCYTEHPFSVRLSQLFCTRRLGACRAINFMTMNICPAYVTLVFYSQAI